jgi:O-antigen ligase
MGKGQAQRDIFGESSQKIMKNKPIILRSYIVFLMLSLSMDVGLFPLPRLSVESVPSGLFAILIGMILPLFFISDVLFFFKKNRRLLFLCLLFLISASISMLYSPFPKPLGAKMLAQYGFCMGGALCLFFLFSIERGLGLFYLKAIGAMAVVFSFISIFEAMNKSVFLFLADIFRHGAHQIINGRPRPAATLGHSNITGCFLSIGVLVCILLKERLKLKTMVFYPAVLSLSVSIALISSRNAMLVLAVPLIVLFFNGKTVKTAFAVFIIYALCTMAFTPSVSRIADIWHLLADVKKSTNIHNRPDMGKGAIKSDEFNSAATRLMLWESAIRMFKDNPVLGVGPGGYNRALKDYSSAALLAVERTNIDKEYLNAHNGFLNLLAEFGIAGTTVGCVFLWMVFLNTARRYPIFPPSPVYALLLGMILSFGPDAFFYSRFYMILFLSLLFLFAFTENPLSYIVSAPHIQPASQNKRQERFGGNG